ncbi:hypothetical protein [uncultured Clostridium sp.]|uniref:hypothetical protein n=1 Tax=uncultured Clostridium sp. TaxID=59620 RepID=UPI00260D16A3|nr:hypothetical protein [uncultured Clostridium sp.]
MAKAKQIQEDEEIKVEIKEKNEVNESKAIVYIGTHIKTPYIVLNRFTTLLDKPKNWDDMVKKSEDVEKLFVSIDYFSKNLQQIKTSHYYKELTKKVQKELGGN